MAKTLTLSCNGAANQNGANGLDKWDTLDSEIDLQFLQPLKILMTTDTSSSVWTYSLELAQALTQKGHKVALAALGAPLTAKQYQEIEEIAGLEVFESNFKWEGVGNSWQDIQAAGCWLLQLEQQVQPHLVHLNGYVHGALPWQVPKVVVGHSCMLSRWRAVKGQPYPKVWEEYQQYVRQGLQAANLVLAPTQALLTELEYHYGPLPHSRVIPYGRTPYLFWFERKKPFILTASRVWDEAKNIRALETVAPRLSWPIYIAGEDKHLDGGSRQFRHVNLLGQLAFEELLPWFAQASIYALPARYESFGFSALEAAMAGCALVLGDIPSLREVWGDAALYVPPNDLEELEVALILLIIDPIFRTIMARRAYARAQRFTSERMAADYLSVYQALIQTSRAIAAYVS
jgi:hypothetical protein